MSSGQCHHCGRTVSPLFYYSGKIVDPALSADPDLAREQPEIEEACAECIAGGNLNRDTYETMEATRLLSAGGADVPRMLDAMHRHPDAPLFLRDFDWPVCCREWCEFIGVPESREEGVRVPAAFTFWRHGPAVWDYGFDLEPESLLEVNRFRCLQCSKPYFVWQCT